MAEAKRGRYGKEGEAARFLKVIVEVLKCTSTESPRPLLPPANPHPQTALTSTISSRLPRSLLSTPSSSSLPSGPTLLLPRPVQQLRRPRHSRPRRPRSSGLSLRPPPSRRSWCTTSCSPSADSRSPRSTRSVKSSKSTRRREFFPILSQKPR